MPEAKLDGETIPQGQRRLLRMPRLGMSAQPLIQPPHLLPVELLRLVARGGRRPRDGTARSADSVSTQIWSVILSLNPLSVHLPAPPRSSGLSKAAAQRLASTIHPLRSLDPYSQGGAQYRTHPSEWRRAYAGSAPAQRRRR